jgi:hypothetical protein
LLGLDLGYTAFPIIGMTTSMPNCGNDHAFISNKIGDVKRKAGYAAITA